MTQLQSDSAVEVEKSCGNVYADLGMPDAEEMQVKCQLSMKIEEIIKSRRWTQQQAAEVLGMPQPKLSNMLRGQFRGISQTKMLECLNLLGCDVQIVVGPENKANVRPGRLDVVFA